MSQIQQYKQVQYILSEVIKVDPKSKKKSTSYIAYSRDVKTKINLFKRANSKNKARKAFALLVDSMDLPNHWENSWKIFS